MCSAQRCLAALFLRVVAFLRVAAALRVPRFLEAAAFFPAATRFVDFLRVGLRLVDLRPVVLFLVAAAFLPAADRFAVFRFRVAADFFAAADLFAAGLFRVAVFLAAIPVPLSSVVTKGLGLRRHPFEAPSFPFAHPAPHAVPLIATKRLVEALDPNGAL